MKIVAGVCLLVGASLVAVACGGSTTEPAGGSGPDTGATPADVQSACSSGCDRDARCRNNSVERCMDDCLEDTFAVLGPNMRSDMLRAYSTCTANLPCDSNDDECEDAMYAALGFTRAELRNEPEVQECLAAGATCSEYEDTISEFCTVQMVLIGSARARFVACYAEPCETMLSCARSVLYGSG